ncbi:hypothetical protein Poli38472_007637 [Pythium oligandrum]|uniref:Uncharacterized protein n=1 Tax=Pythium oligandrum TaxID=41045 RepID=A0A8K1FL83_PYTOL|nr:hypothetical protein Poli38472_007637 [Pythium oligandrum]|eukprot:TMW67965.1 hypothetical protein Poli38472_007637 [Pythium oligandrum]
MATTKLLDARQSPQYATFDALERSYEGIKDKRGCVSRLLLSWVTPLMVLAHEKQLEAHDLWPLQREHQAEVNALRFTRDFQETQSIPKAFLRSFGLRFVLTGVAFLVSMLCNLVGPMVLKHVVGALTGQDFAVMTVTEWIAVLFVSQVVQAMVDNYANFDSELIAIQFVGSLKSLLYDKTLRLSAKSRKAKSTGEISNIFTSDSDSILQAAYLVHQAWLLPLQITVVSYLLYDLLGVAAFAGIAFIMLLLFINNRVSNLLFGYHRVYRSSRDQRMKRINEVFKGISIVKLNAWEEKFMERIEEVRKDELKNLFRLRMMASISITLLWGMPMFISIVTFGTYALVLKNELSPSIVFTSLALFQLIQGPLRQVTNVIIMLIQSKVALERATAFLEMEEIDPSNVQTIDSPVADQYIMKNTIIAIEQGEFCWDEGAVQLRDVNLNIKAGEFYVIHGPVGCGKSSFCSALLGDMVKTKGTVYVGGTVAYCSQQPWIQNMTVRDNITFGLPYERKKYEKIIDACALTKDLSSLPAGDMTEIGERGINLSGGQKARVALARACYSDASIFILDSPLSAVDAIVQNEIYNKCLLGLLRHKTIILITHNPEIIASEYITHAVTIDERGKLVETHRIQSRPTHDSLVSPLASRVYTMETFEVAVDKQGCREMNQDAVIKEEDALEQAEELPIVSPFKRANRKSFVEIENDTDSANKEAGRLIKDEARAEGRVKNHVFAAYYHALGGLPVVMLLLLPQVLGQAVQISSDFWLGSWSSDSLSGSTITTETRLGVYSLMGLGVAVMVMCRMVLTAVFGIRAAKSLFDRMTNALMHAPMRFFDVNPIGRILTRYGGDVFAVDAALPFMLTRSTAIVLSLTSITVTSAVVIQWKGLLVIPVVILYAKIGAFYIEPARELQRLTKTIQAPVLNHLAESFDGIAVLRAFGTQTVNRFRTTNHIKLDESNKVRYAQLGVSQWFSLRIQLVGTILVVLVATSLVMLREELAAAVIGLAFSYALRISNSLESIVQLISRVETAMVSPERMQEYIDIPQERPHRIPSLDPPSHSSWPTQGSIEFKSVSFRYKENDHLVLHDLNLSIDGGEKIGIVGRTGAGKSSLTMALFRINELANGSIVIDDVDVNTIGLKTLREKLSIIPQNPVLFKGPLRHYLDPFEQFTDDELWHSINRVGLRDRITAEEKGLWCLVEESGENFSVGERQMLCMARALSRHSRIVIFDEATAAIDHETDQKLQRVIREAFEQSTVLTIAHRLDTILDADRILVLEGGRVVEFASPAELVKKGSGHFFELMQEGGYLGKFLAQSTE